MTTSRVAATAGRRGGRASIGLASLAVGPLIMAVGDLLHPKETADTGAQAAIVAGQATRWYLAHLLLLVGMVVLVPGLLVLTDLAAASGRRVGYAARVLVVVGVAGSAAVFLAEMLAGRIAATAGAPATQDYLDVLFSPPIAGPMLLVMLALFVGAALFAVPLIVGSGPLRWPATVFLVGTLLVLAEIASSQVLLSQVGNVVIWGGGVAFAWRLARGGAGVPLGAGAGEPLPADARSSSRAATP